MKFRKMKRIDYTQETTKDEEISQTFYKSRRELAIFAMFELFTDQTDQLHFLTFFEISVL